MTKSPNRDSRGLVTTSKISTKSLGVGSLNNFLTNRRPTKSGQKKKKKVELRKGSKLFSSPVMGLHFGSSPGPLVSPPWQLTLSRPLGLCHYSRGSPIGGPLGRFDLAGLGLAVPIGHVTSANLCIGTGVTE